MPFSPTHSDRFLASVAAALLGAVLLSALPAAAQETPAASAATPASAASPTSPAAPPPGPSAETLKKARDVGLHAETRKGSTVYCWEEADIGSRFKSKKCVPESQLDEIIARRAALQQNFRQGTCAGMSCG